jgi:hypothetical protein
MATDWLPYPAVSVDMSFPLVFMRFSIQPRSKGLYQ